MQSLSNIAEYENGLIGIQWDNLDEEVGSFSMRTCLIMMFIDIILYLLLTLYLDQVWISRFG